MSIQFNGFSTIGKTPGRATILKMPQRSFRSRDLNSTGCVSHGMVTCGFLMLGGVFTISAVTGGAMLRSPSDRSISETPTGCCLHALVREWFSSCPKVTIATPLALPPSTIPPSAILPAWAYRFCSNDTRSRHYFSQPILTSSSTCLKSWSPVTSSALRSLASAAAKASAYASLPLAL